MATEYKIVQCRNKVGRYIYFRTPWPVPSAPGGTMSDVSCPQCGQLRYPGHRGPWFQHFVVDLDDDDITILDLEGKIVDG